LLFLQAEQELGQLRGNLQDQQSMTKQEAQRVSGTAQCNAAQRLKLAAGTCATSSVKTLQPSQIQHSLSLLQHLPVRAAQC
jgi:hypothetical protein